MLRCIRYNPPTPTFSSSIGVSGTVEATPQLTYTATFDTAVTGVVAADFGLASSVAGVTTTKSVSTTDNLVWVLAVEITAGFATTDVSVTIPLDSGAIANKNAAGTNNGFYLTCALPCP